MTTAFELVLIHRIELASALHRAVMYLDAADELRLLGRQLRNEPQGRAWDKDVWIAAYHMGPVLSDLRNLGLIEESLATELRGLWASCDEQKREARAAALRRLEEAAEQDQAARASEPSPVAEGLDA